MAASERNGTPLLVLRKITTLLDAFSLERPVLTIGQLREASGLPASTVQRLVTNLVDEGFLDRAQGGLRIGVRVAYWAAAGAVGAEILDVARPVLEDLRDATGETACLYQPSLDVRVCTALAETRHNLRRPMRVGQAMPIHVGSAGRVILAWDHDLAQRVLAEDLPSMTDATITDRDRLNAVLAQARADGFAITTGERESGASGLSAPVFDPRAQVIGAVTVMGPTLRMPYEVCVGWVDLVVGAAERVTRMLGGRFPRPQ